MGKVTKDHETNLQILRQLAEAAPKLESVTVDLNNAGNPKYPMETILKNPMTLRRLKVTQLGTEIVGISYLSCLAGHTGLKKLELNFSRLRQNDITKQAFAHFPYKGNTSVETLVINLNSASAAKANSITND